MKFKQSSSSSASLAGKKRELEAFLNETMEELFEYMEMESVTGGDFVQPWKNQPNGIPYNLATGHRFRGGNQFRLMLSSITRGFGDPRYMTYSQAEQMDAQVQKGAKGIKLLRPFIKKIETESAGAANEYVSPEEAFEGLFQEKELVFFKPYYVFNASQVDGIEPLSAEREGVDWEKDVESSLVERLVSASGATCRNGGNIAAFSPTEDILLMPAMAQFESPTAYQAVKAHEWFHWTGAQKRENRDLKGGFGSPAYALEELRAETFSLCFGKAFNLPFEIRQHAAYIASWKKALKADVMSVFGAASQAMSMLEVAIDFNNGAQPKPDWFPIIEHTYERDLGACNASGVELSF